MHGDFFFMAATPVVKVFLMLVVRRNPSWEAPSRPAMEPDEAVAPTVRLVNSELMIFLHKKNRPNQHHVLMDLISSVALCGTYF